jgi:hypothetical protein
MVGERQAFAAAQEKFDIAIVCQETTSLLQLSPAKVHTD